MCKMDLLGRDVLSLPWETRSFGAERPRPPSTGSGPQPQFRPLTEADAQDNLAQLRTAAAALDQRFARAGESAEGWKTYLSWPTAQAELQKSKPDPAVLVDELEKLGAGYDGLELKPFADLRSVLGNYLFVAVPNPNLPAGGKEHILALTQEEAAVGDRPTTEQTRKIADDVLWLDRFRQAPESVKNVRQRFDKPNFGVRIGKQVLDMGIGGPVDDVAPIQDVIMGTYINGTGRTVGQTSAALGADAETAARFATFDAVMRGVNYSSSVGRNGPVCIYTTGQTCLSAAKRFWIDGAGLHDLPTVAVAQTCTTIDNIVSIKGRRIVENIAWRRAGKQKGEAEAIAGQHASARLDARINAQAAPSVAQANERFQTKVKSPLEERRAYPQVPDILHAAVGGGDRRANDDRCGIGGANFSAAACLPGGQRGAPACGSRSGHRRLRSRVGNQQRDRERAHRHEADGRDGAALGGWADRQSAR